VFTARDALCPYIKQIRFVFKGLIGLDIYKYVWYAKQSDVQRNCCLNTCYAQHVIIILTTVAVSQRNFNEPHACATLTEFSFRTSERHLKIKALNSEKAVWKPEMLKYIPM
jgi:hypothetical protein